MKLGQLIDIAMSNIVRKIFAWFGGLGPISRPFLVYQPAKINQKPILISFWFFTLLNVRTESFKNNNHHLLKCNKSHYNAISWKSLSSLHNKAKNELEMLVIGCTITWSHFNQCSKDWFFHNNSKTVQAVTLAFCSIE